MMPRPNKVPLTARKPDLESADMVRELRNLRRKNRRANSLELFQWFMKRDMSKSPMASGSR